MSGPGSSGDVAAASGGNKWRVTVGVRGSDVGGGTLGLGAVGPVVLPEAGVGSQAAPAAVAALDSPARQGVLEDEFRLFLQT